MSRTYLILSLTGLAATLNALRPFPGTLTLLPGFFASWLTVELAPLLLIGHIACNIWMIAAGAVEGAQGWTALGISVVVAAGLVFIVAGSWRVVHVLDAAMREVHDEFEGVAGRRVPWPNLLMPFWLRHSTVERTANIAYGPAGRRNRLDVYRPRDGVVGAPVLIQIHGGGWVISNKNQQGKPVMMHFARRGWVCVAPNYRLAPRATWPDPIVDVKRAIAWTRAHISEYGGDPSFIVVTGGSAGGHLAALAALTANDPAFQPGFEDADTGVQAAVPMYGVYDLTSAEDRKPAVRRRLPMLERMVFKKQLVDAREEFEQASPLHRAHAAAPPFFVIHGRHDLLTSIEETRRFVARLRERSRNPVAYAELPGTQHAFDVFHSIRSFYAVNAIEEFARWARTAAAQHAPASKPVEA